MHLSLTTFIIEIVNFLVLVWILRRFLFAPVKRAIEARRASVERMIEDSEKARTEAAAIRTQYENRLKDWNQEKDRSRAEFQKDLETEKTRQMKTFYEQLEQERAKARARDEQAAGEIRAAIERQAMRQAMDFSCRFLSSFASPELESRIIDLVTKRIESSGAPLAQFPPQGLRNGAKISVRSAFPLRPDQSSTLAKALAKNLGVPMEPVFSVDPALVAGLEIDLGVADLKANIRDELQLFSESGEG